MSPWEKESVWNYALGRRLALAASRRGVTLGELSRRTLIPYQTLYGYVHHGRRMPAYALVKLCRALEVEISELVGGVRGEEQGK